MDHRTPAPARADREREGWHHRTATDALAALHTSAQGLSEDEATRRRESHGPNRLPEAPRPGLAVRFVRQFHNVLVYVLLGAAVITAALGHVADTGVILAVVLANAVIGLVQEGKAERAMNAIRSMLAPRAAVLREGARRTVDGALLVPGDLVLLEAGDRVPADLRLLQARGLQVQEAILTGESVPTDKRTEPVAVDAPLGDRACLAFSGTTVTSGQGRGVVVATGAATEIGRISGLLARVETLVTPLVAQMGAFARWLSLFILCIAGLILAYGAFVAHLPFVELFMAVVGLSVAAIPEGLPAVLTITLAVGVQAMARRSVIVRRLPAIETLGSVSVICSDKTGTLTRNEMAVVSLVTSGGTLRIDGVGYAPEGAITLERAALPAACAPIVARAAHAAALCNDADLQRRNGEWSVEGDPMEGALLAFATKAGVSVRDLRQSWQRTDLIPFDARHRYMATLDHDHENHASIFVKGAPERVVAMCASQLGDDGVVEPVDAPRWHEEAARIARLGQRVIALAVRPTTPEHTVLEHADVEGSLTLVGLLGLVDPPRPEAIAAVAECRSAGIRVKMITGDHAATAAAIGEQIGLQAPVRVLTGSELDGLDAAALAAAVLETDVFARTSPEHKLRLVEALQSHGMTVAMTGDGVNDAPALKRADAGIAMGLKGSEAAKEAAELVLADDNFASIAAAVREGRTVYDNIKKVISWTLPTNAGEASVIIVALLLGMMLPVTPIQILWVNTITAITLGIALAFEPTEDDTMRRPPRRRDEPLLGGSLVWHIGLVAALFLAGVFGIYDHAVDRGYSLELARTMAMNTLVVMEIFHLFYIRNVYTTSLTWKAARGTPAVWAAVVTVTVAQLAITYLPALQRIFATEPVALLDGVLIVGIGVVLLAVIEVEKQLRLRLAALRVRR
ncbi:MAG: HAD-IC family P-type ATPase [Ectothiorhodospiraceae bacterium]|nr:HAD-IC family P-type ATPase [Ectothiorhodospiraceae bacterium]